jgi:hypothetical protein
MDQEGGCYDDMGACKDLRLPHIDAHTSGRPLDAAHRRFEVEAIQIRHLDLGNFFDLLLRDRADLVLVRLGRAARLISTGTGDVLVMKVKERSE